ncbi:MAG TPA: DUF2726 domain-containing protein [Methylophilaceae bacterium]|nr:DUF2726 domain-containing protein [Methylophilaceae bacterium]
MILSSIGLVIFAVLVLLLVTAKPRTNTSEFYGTKPLSEMEQVAYWRLVEACGTDKIILSQVAFSRFIRTKGGNRKGRASNFGKARQKVADFVICNKDFSIFAIVEIDDKLHNKEKDEARDKITKAAGFKTIRVLAKELPNAMEFRRALGL